MTTMAAIMTRMAAAAGTTRFKFINMASSGFSFSPDSLAGAIVAEKNKKNKNLIFGLEKLFAQ